MKTGLIVLCLFFLCSVSQGQEYFASTRKIDVEQGLTHYRILSLNPGEDGMWIGTGDGLNYFDGYQWKYWTKESGALNATAVNFIHRDSKKNLWLFNTKNTELRKRVRNIDILKPHQDKAVSIEEYFGEDLPFKVADIQHFTQDEHQQLYFQVKNQLWRYSSIRAFELITMPLGFAPNTIFSDGTYVGELNGMLAVVSTAGEVTQELDYQLLDTSYTIVGNMDHFWIWQPHNSCNQFEKTTSGSYTNRPFNLQNYNTNDLRLLYYDPLRKLICAASKTHTFLIDENDEIIAQKKFSSRVACNDQNGNIWTGKHDVQIIRLEDTKFERYLYQADDKIGFEEQNRCRGIIKRNDLLLINTYNGLKNIDLQNGEEIQDKLQDKTCYFAFLEDDQNQLWTAYRELKTLSTSHPYNKSVYYFDDDRVRIWSLFQDRNDRIWLGAGATGLNYLEDDKLHTFGQFNAFPELALATVLSFYKDKNGVIWLISDLGLYILDLEKGVVQRFSKNNSNLPSMKYQHMYQDEQGIYWLATEDAGLVSWNKTTDHVQIFDKDFGFQTNNIYAVYEDEFGYLWMSTFNGIIRFHKHLSTFEVFHEADGTSGNEFNRISHYQAKNGHIYFGGQNGVTGFHPKNFVGKESTEEKFNLSVKHTSVFARHVLKDTMPNGKPIDLMHLHPGTRVIDFEIAGSDIFWTDKVDLHYSLTQLGKNGEPISSSKENISSDNKVELFGMYSGRYDLEIKALQKNGKQVGKAINIPLAIAKPLFHSPLFWLSMIILASISIFLIHKIKLARLRRRKAELEVLIVEKAKKIVEDQRIIELQAEQITDMKGQLNRKDENLLEQFKSIIQERLGDSDLYLPGIIDDLDVSRSNFYEKVKTLTGMTPNQYILEMRLNRAKELLESGMAKTVKEVSFTVGFKRPAYFSKLFKERFGMKPSAYFRVHG